MNCNTRLCHWNLGESSGKALSLLTSLGVASDAKEAGLKRTGAGLKHTRVTEQSSRRAVIRAVMVAEAGQGQDRGRSQGVRRRNTLRRSLQM